jgi:hypothetical protein
MPLTIEYGILRLPDLRGKIIELPVCRRCHAVVGDKLGHTKWHETVESDTPRRAVDGGA